MAQIARPGYPQLVNRALLAWFVVLLLGACDFDPRASYLPAQPVESSLLSGSVDVPRAQEIRIRYDRPLQERHIDLDKVRIVSGGVRAPIRLVWEPLEKTLRIIPITPLAANLGYRLQVDTLRSLNGALSESFEIDFTTGVDLGVAALIPEPTFAQVEAVFDNSCAFVGCHRGSEALPPRMGLDLSGPDAIALTAINQPSRQMGGRAYSGEGGLSGRPIIDVPTERGRPGESYLVHKLLGTEAIIGVPMPQSDSIEPEDIQLIIDWIRAGASLE